MPCNTDHMEPTVRESQLREAGQHILYLADAMGIDLPAQHAADAAAQYGNEANVPRLCSMLTGMTDVQMNEHVYDGRNPRARRVADWWDEHQKEDWKRREEEAKKEKSFDTCLELAQQYLKGGYSVTDTAGKIGEVTGKYFDFEDNNHTFEFEDGVIMLTGMDGLVAYKGKRVA